MKKIETKKMSKQFFAVDAGTKKNYELEKTARSIRS